MDFTPKKNLPNPEEKANFFSKIFFIWVMPFLWKGSKQVLDINDMYNVPTKNESKRESDHLSKCWKKELEMASAKKRKPRLFRALIMAYWKYYLVLSILGAFNEWFIRVAQMVCLRYLILSFNENSPEADNKYYYAGGLILGTFLYTLLLHLPVFETYRLGMICRLATCSLIYQKALKLSNTAQGQTNPGQLVNLLSNDVNRFEHFLINIKYLIVSPIQTLIFLYFLWVEFGYSVLAGYAYLLILVPLQFMIGKLSTKYRYKIAMKTDRRGQIMSEIIIAMRVIKMYAWEHPFSQMIHHIRKLEVKVLRKSSILKAFYMSIYASSSKIMIFATILVYMLVQDKRLEADKIFFAVAVFENIKLNMAFFIPNAAAFLGELIISMKRLENFMLLDEQKENSVLFKEKEEEETKVILQNVSASWTEDKSHLDDISIKFEGNKLVIVVGCPVGASKSSLLNLLINELPISKGNLKINGKISYASQEPWIFPGNVLQNILFGSEYEEKRYNEVVRVSALETDYKQLPFGDKTIVGERGVALSGGQKARIGLARALYQKADIYLLDDPLSAVDSAVSRHIFDKCLKRHLKDKLRILVTHQLQYLPLAEQIVVLNLGKVVDQGTYEELVKKGIDFVSLMAGETEDELQRKESVKKEEQEKKEKEDIRGKPEENIEKMEAGSVSLSTYWDYFKSGNSYLGIFFVAFFFIVGQFFYTASDWFLSYWTNEEEKYYNKDKKSNSVPIMSSEEDNSFWNLESYVRWFLTTEGKEYDRDTFLYIYAGISLIVFVLMKLRGLCFFTYCMRISINIHNKMFRSIVRAPIKFFDDNPSGRIMNRFTKDIGSMDEMLIQCFFDFLMIFAQMFGVFVIVFISNYFIAIPTFFIFIMLWLIRRFYINTTRSVKRLEAITRSPIFTQLGTSLQGLTTIRALGKQKILIDLFDLKQDLNTSTWFLFISTTRWFGVWLELVTILFLVAVTLSFLLLDTPLSGNVGLALSSTISMTGIFQWGMRQSAETENHMTSVERNLEYAKITPEAELESKQPDKKPPTNWPSKGEIIFQKVSLSYEVGKYVLKDLSFKIEGGQKIGVVGRTGAGKSTIIAALFRMTEPQGQIFIDGICINEIGLHELRKNISIIPQDPVLFSGTVRYNLDPFDQFKDDELWKVLEEVELKSEIPALDYLVTESGGNFSIGQRQLVCLGRAILRKNKIIVMDEATANVDPRTDNFIQNTIREKFKDCCIITIAHRLATVMDCDKILVLEAGTLKEYDHPHLLLQNEDGFLTSMINHTGKTSAAMLRNMAQNKFEGKKVIFEKNHQEDS